MRRQGRDTHEEGPPYRWNMKYYHWESEYEVEDARRFVFGEYVQMKTKRYGSNNARHTFDQLEDIVGKEVEAGFEGRSGGWFVIYDELTTEEYARVTKHVADAMDHAIKEFLVDEREFRRHEAELEAEEERERKQGILADARIARILRQLHKHFPDNFTLVIRGVDVVQAHAELLTEPEKVL
jgi:hypothetical protein